MVKKIYLTKGKFTLVDEADFEWLIGDESYCIVSDVDMQEGAVKDWIDGMSIGDSLCGSFTCNKRFSKKTQLNI